jgi:hypothetical protein
VGDDPGKAPYRSRWRLLEPVGHVRCPCKERLQVSKDVVETLALSVGSPIAELPRQKGKHRNLAVGARMPGICRNCKASNDPRVDPRARAADDVWQVAAPVRRPEAWRSVTAVATTVASKKWRQPVLCKALVGCDFAERSSRFCWIAPDPIYSRRVSLLRSACDLYRAEH